MKPHPRIPAQAILAFLRRVEKADVLLHGFELRFAGEVQAEGYYAPFCKGEMHRMYSVSKSMVSLAIGILEAEGRLCLDDPVVRYFPEKVTAATDGRLLRLTIRDMLRMATCYVKTTYDPAADADWTAAFFTAAPSHEPGTVFSYDTSSTQVLGALCQRLSGEALLSFLTCRVFAPIGADDPKAWLTDPAGNAQGGTGLLLSLRDLGKTAQLLLDGGRGIVPADYLRRATMKQIGTPFQPVPEERLGYGYQFWRGRDGYMLYGMGGQLALICPAKKLILCTIGDTQLDPLGMQSIYDAFYETLVPAAPVTDEPQADRAALSQALSGLRVRPLPHCEAFAVPFASRYRMADGTGDLREVWFTGEEVRLVWADGVHTYAYRLGGVCDGTLPHWNTRCLTFAGFGEDGVLRLRCHQIESAPCGLELLFSKRADALTVQMRSSGDLSLRRYQGFFWGEAAPE